MEYVRLGRAFQAGVITSARNGGAKSLGISRKISAYRAYRWGAGNKEWSQIELWESWALKGAHGFGVGCGYTQGSHIRRSSYGLPGVKSKGLLFQKSKATLQKVPLPFPNPGRQGRIERKHSHHCLTERETEAH